MLENGWEDMKKETKEIIRLTTFEILGGITDAAVWLSGLSARKKVTRKMLCQYWQNREVDKADFAKKIWRLKRQGMIREFYEGKEKYYEITKRGQDHLANVNLENIAVERPKIWDKKWRVVIYDVPEDDRIIRNFIRSKLYQIGFIQVQKSVFIYPFECSSVINQICHSCGERDCLKYMIAEIIEGEESIIERFLDDNILTADDLI
jgi:CRISPR-associated endonuclease Cas2